MYNDLGRVIVRAVLLLALGAALVPANADSGTLYVAPGPTTLVSPDVIKRSQEQPGDSSRKLGDLIGSSLKILGQSRNRFSCNDQVRALPIGHHYLRGRIGKNTEPEQCPGEPKRYGSSQGRNPDIADHRGGWMRRMTCGRVGRAG